MLAAAIRQAKSANPKNITQVLHRINGYAPVTGTMDWDEKGELHYGTRRRVRTARQQPGTAHALGPVVAARAVPR